MHGNSGHKWCVVSHFLGSYAGKWFGNGETCAEFHGPLSTISLCVFFAGAAAAIGVVGIVDTDRSCKQISNKNGHENDISTTVFLATE